MDHTRPFDFLNKNIGKNVLVILKDTRQLRGVIKAFDVHLNVVLENAEMLDSQGEVLKKIGNLIVRGDNILLISL